MKKNPVHHLSELEIDAALERARAFAKTSGDVTKPRQLVTSTEDAAPHNIQDRNA